MISSKHFSFLYKLKTSSYIAVLFLYFFLFEQVYGDTTKYELPSYLWFMNLINIPIGVVVYYFAFYKSKESGWTKVLICIKIVYIFFLLNSLFMPVYIMKDGEPYLREKFIIISIYYLLSLVHFLPLLKFRKRETFHVVFFSFCISIVVGLFCQVFQSFNADNSLNTLAIYSKDVFYFYPSRFKFYIDMVLLTICFIRMVERKKSE